MRRADRIAGILVLLFSIAVMEGGRRMPPSKTFGPGAGFLPFWLGALLALLSVLLIVQAWRRSARTGDAPRPLIPSRAALVAVLSTAGGLAAYILLLEPLGFLLATTLFGGFLLGVVERERWTVALTVSVLNAIALHVVFQRLLGVSLPQNVLGF
jgi:putative tricarboxylic transport membrane protein